MAWADGLPPYFTAIQITELGWSWHITWDDNHQRDLSQYTSNSCVVQTQGLNTTPSLLFLTDFVAQIQVWQRQGDRLLIFMDMNEHVLRSTVACHLLSIGLIEATHQHWGNKEPHTFISGVEPIDGVWHTPNLEVSAVVQLSFHEGLGDHCVKRPQ